MHRLHLRKLRAVSRVYAVSIGLWSCLSMLTGWQNYISERQHNLHSSLLEALSVAGARGFAFATLTPVIFYLVHRYASGVNRPFLYLGAGAAGLGPFMVIDSWLRWAALALWGAALPQYIAGPEYTPLGMIQSEFADQITIYIAIVIAAHAYEYFKRGRRQELENYELQSALSVSEQQALKLQLHPHFLFNTLHGISTLIDADRMIAKVMLLKLSGLLRRMLGSNSCDLISLREELRFTREYLDLEKMRLGGRLTVEWSIDADTEKTLVPQLILQPLVENAVRYGLASARYGGWIEIVSRRRPGNLEIIIRNSIGGKPDPGFGIGLRNTRARLRNLYSDQATLSFADGDGIATATIVVPVLFSSFEMLPKNSEPVDLDRMEGEQSLVS